MTQDKLPGTENMKCAIGLYEGSRTYVEGPFKGTSVHGVFSYVDVSDEPCEKPVRFWCKRKGSNHAWLACDNPEHRRDAEAVLELTPEYIAFLVWQQKPGQPMPELLKNRVKRDPFLDAPKKLVESTPEPKALPAKQRIPRNKKQKKPRTLTQAIDKLPNQKKAKAYKEALQLGGKVMAVVMGLVDKEKG
jgi:hypothetical protein